VLPLAKNPLRFRHRLEKILFLESHIDAMVKFGCSDRFRDYLNAPLQIQRVTSGKEQDRCFDITPITILDRITESAATAYSRPPQSDIIKHCDAIVRRLQSQYGENTSANITCTNHAECVLLSYHIRTRDAVQPFNYFGRSKLECLAYHLYFLAYNDAAQRLQFPLYRIRGAYRKLYKGWAAPNLGDVSSELQEMISDSMVVRLKKELADHLELLHQRAFAARSSGLRDDAMNSLYDADSFRAEARKVLCINFGKILGSWLL
jgi:hypothetical protein